MLKIKYISIYYTESINVQFLFVKQKSKKSEKKIKGCRYNTRKG